MTERSMLFQRPRGQGWLVLADRPPALGGEYSHLANSLLVNADLSYQPLCILGDEGRHTDLVDFITDLQALLDVEIAIVRLEDIKDWDTIDPGIVILVGGKTEDWVGALGETHLGVLILQGFMNGMLLLSIGVAAAALGSWVLEESHVSPLPGLNWLVGSIVLHWTAEPAEYEVIRSILTSPEPLYAMGLAGGRMIALGPRGEVEFWGVNPPSLVLGSGWRK
ncbi:MAG: hypothetical protein A2Z14_03760 [Chloroflexi bacterium RBG_16_48_8]|nr:MAG: hypothetical protein A2Z14_03760 [Chloroflexi bacterium RBG_16_48_8]